jgi:hypothetical protein
MEAGFQVGLGKGGAAFFDPQQFPCLGILDGDQDSRRKGDCRAYPFPAIAVAKKLNEKRSSPERSIIFLVSGSLKALPPFRLHGKCNGKTKGLSTKLENISGWQVFRDDVLRVFKK